MNFRKWNIFINISISTHITILVTFNINIFCPKLYSKYVSSIFSEEHKAEVRKTQFPKDLKNAYDIGIKIANDAQKIL